MLRERLCTATLALKAREWRLPQFPSPSGTCKSSSGCERVSHLLVPVARTSSQVDVVEAGVGTQWQRWHVRQ